MADGDQTVEFEADLRFSKQIYELQMPITAGTLHRCVLGRTAGRVQGRVRQALRQGLDRAAARRSSWWACGPSASAGPSAPASGTAARPAVETGTLAVPVGTRKVRLDRGADGIVEVDVYDGAGLSPGHELKGPALVDSMDTTVWVPEGSSARIDEHGTFIME